MIEVSLKEHLTRQRELRIELCSFLPAQCGCCDNCQSPKKVPLSLLNREWLCQECWKWEKAFLEGRAARTGPLPLVGNPRAVVHRDDIDYHGFGTPHTLGRTRKADRVKS